MHDKIAKARALIDLRRYEHARELLTEVLAVEPDNVSALADMGKVALMLGDGERALEFTAATLRLAPENIFAWRIRVYAALRTARAERDPALRRAAAELALAAARRAVEIDPLASRSFQALASAQRGTDPQAALASLDRAVEIDPENVVAHQLRADILGEDLDRREESEAALHTVLRLDPENAAARFDLALIELDRGDRVAAVRRLRGIGATHPRWGSTVRAQLDLIALRDQLDALAERYPAAVRLVRRHPRLADLLAHVPERFPSMSNAARSNFVPHRYKRALVALPIVLGVLIFHEFSGHRDSGGGQTTVVYPAETTAGAAAPTWPRSPEELQSWTVTPGQMLPPVVPPLPGLPR